MNKKRSAPIVGQIWGAPYTDATESEDKTGAGTVRRFGDVEIDFGAIEWLQDFLGKVLAPLEAGAAQQAKELERCHRECEKLSAASHRKNKRIQRLHSQLVECEAARGADEG